MIIVKIGGGASINIKGIISDLAEQDNRFIIVHGANALRDQLADELGYPKISVTSVSGYSSVLTDEKALDIMMMAYAGLKNKRIVELCQQHGINAVGLSGVDGKVIQSKRNKGIRVKQNNKLMLLKDLSGKAFSINKSLLDLLLNNNYTPVLCVPTIDENNVATNSENDDIVAVLQKEFAATMILQLIEAPGLLKEKNDPSSLITQLSQDDLERIENEVEGRMKRKILALRKLFEAGNTTVIISDGRTETPIKDALNGKGTTIK